VHRFLNDIALAKPEISFAVFAKSRSSFSFYQQLIAQGGKRCLIKLFAAIVVADRQADVVNAHSLLRIFKEVQKLSLSYASAIKTTADRAAA
jgi:hypothetical protein